MSVDPVYKVARSGARVEEMRWRDRTVIDGILGIDVVPPGMWLEFAWRDLQQLEAI
jgi:hypothetical protein